MANKESIKALVPHFMARQGFKPKRSEMFITEVFHLIQDRLQKDKIVKVRGLGTFKVVEVKSRESVNIKDGERHEIAGHEKITFTPDPVLREIINRPFAHFENVELSEGFDLDTAKKTFEETTEVEKTETVADADEKTIAPAEEKPKPRAKKQQTRKKNREKNASNTANKENVSALRESQNEESVRENVPEEAEERLTTNLLKATPVREEKVTEHPLNAEPDNEPTEPMPLKKSSSWLKALPYMILSGLLCLALGYYLGSKANRGEQKAIQPEQVEDLPDSLQTAKDTLKTAEETPSKVSQKAEQTQNESINYDELNRRDARVRLGAYRITGVANVVTVQEGQTLGSISRAYFGPGMECYVEALNGVKTVKAGDKLKIPELQMKGKKPRR